MAAKRKGEPGNDRQRGAAHSNVARPGPKGKARVSVHGRLCRTLPKNNKSPERARERVRGRVEQRREYHSGPVARFWSLGANLQPGKTGLGGQGRLGSGKPGTAVERSYEEHRPRAHEARTNAEALERATKALSTLLETRSANVDLPTGYEAFEGEDLALRIEDLSGVIRVVGVDGQRGHQGPCLQSNGGRGGPTRTNRWTARAFQSSIR